MQCFRYSIWTPPLQLSIAPKFAFWKASVWKSCNRNVLKTRETCISSSCISVICVKRQQDLALCARLCWLLALHGFLKASSTVAYKWVFGSCHSHTCPYPSKAAGNSQQSFLGHPDAGSLWGPRAWLFENSKPRYPSLYHQHTGEYTGSKKRLGFLLLGFLWRNQ